MTMKRYDLLYACRQCRQPHPMGVALELPHGPTERLSLNAYRATRTIPPSIAKLVGRPVICPHSGEHIVTKDPDRIFIQPLSKTPKNNVDDE
jgi:hypothetical protein